VESPVVVDLGPVALAGEGPLWGLATDDGRLGGS